MTLDELKLRATATESCLIEAVEKALTDQIRERVLTDTLNFISTHKLPAMEDVRFNPDAIRDWVKKLEDHIQ